MKILLADNKKITRFQAPSKIDDAFLLNHVIQDKEYSILLENINNVLYLKSSGSVDVVINNIVEERIKIEYYKKYVVKFVGIQELMSLYFIPNSENLFKVAFDDLESISIGNGPSCHIRYAVDGTCEIQSMIKKSNNEWYISSVNDDEYKIFVNNYRVKSSKIRTGDVIFINGLKIVWMGNFICLNNPQNVLQMNMLRLVDDNFMPPDDIEPVSEDDKVVELYSKDDYFFHYPKIQEKLKAQEIMVDSPPGSSITKRLPWYLTMGTSIIMVSSSFIMGYNVVSGFLQGRTALQMLPQLIMCFSMLLGSLIMPRVLQAYQKRQEKKREAYRQAKYTEYIEEKEKTISNVLKDESRILNDNYLNLDNCIIALNNKNKNFWGRRYEDEEFLTLRLGTGSVDPVVTIRAPEERFSLDSDNLLDRAYAIKKKYNAVVNAPIKVSLKDHKIVSVICQKDNMEKYLYYLMSQLTILHSCIDVKLIIMTSEENSRRWEFAKYLPHVFSDDKSVRFFSTNEDEAKTVSNYVEGLLKERAEEIHESKKAMDLVPYYLVITDDYKNNKNVKVIDDIVNERTNGLGISLLVVEDTIKQTPVSCKTFVEIGDKEGVIIAKQAGLNNQTIFDISDALRDVDMYQVSKALANVPVVLKDGPSVLPTSLSFLDMYKVSKIEQLNIVNRWRMSNPVVSLAAIIGVHANGDRFKLDLHEKFHGPHGLIAGMTGSGKSEFIITFVLSMSISYHPYEVQFVLIDYKGGGLAGAFENRDIGLKIPHLVGTITNLDVSEMNRSLVSIQSELTRRQAIFNETREALNEGTIDIYKYQKLYREGVVKKPLSHLFIICDEFAELKQQRPEFMQSLISIARIGRSLGIHLILATQKPSGLVNDQIWSNSKFKVCLKVQDRSDSMEMLKRPEAASIKETGRFYLQVGYNDLFAIGQSGWSGAKYVPSDKILLKNDESMNFINNVGYQLKTVKEVNENEAPKEDLGEQLINIVKYLDALGKKEKIVTKKLWLDAIPEIIYESEIKAKYKYQPESYYINPLLGEYDDPINQIQDKLNIDLSKEGNLLIYGASGSGKENLLTTLIRSIIVEHTPDEANIYILDCGAESLKIFGSMPHVGDVVTISEQSKIIDMFELANSEIETRKDLFADYAGSYNDYITNSGNKLPLKIFVINNYDSFSEAYGNLTEKIQFLFRDGAKYGVVFIVSAISANAIRSKSAQYFPNKLCLKMGSNDDYRSILGNGAGAPADKYCRGVIGTERGVFEFQTMLFVERKDITKHLRELAKLLNDSYTTKAPKIPSIPDEVRFSDLLSKLNSDTSLPIGYSFKNKDVYYYDFGKQHIIPIMSFDIDATRMSFIFSIMKMLNRRLHNIRVIDFANAYIEKVDGIEAINSNYEEELIKIYNEIKLSKNSEVNTYYIVLGASFLKDNLSEQAYSLFTDLFKNIADYPHTYFILLDVYNGFKLIAMEEWYQNEAYNENGIWLGDSFTSQVLLKSQRLSAEEADLAVPFLGVGVQDGRATFIKHVIDVEDIDE